MSIVPRRTWEGIPALTCTALQERKKEREAERARSMHLRRLLPLPLLYHLSVRLCLVHHFLLLVLLLVVSPHQDLSLCVELPG